jgi:ATP-dependent Clp protease ATP-binding subunit ClpC
VIYDDEAINACVKLSDRYITDRLLPDKAIDVLDEVGARVHLKNINVPKTFLTSKRK